MVAGLVYGIVLRTVSYPRWKDLSRNPAEDGECGVRAVPWGIQQSTQAAHAPASPWGQAKQRLCAAER